MQLSCFCLPAIQTPLVNKFYQANRVRGRATKQDAVWVVKNSSLIAACRLQAIEQETFLSTVFVDQAYRGKGVAKQLLQAAIEQESCVYTFAYQEVVPLYTKLNFIVIDEKELSNKLRQMFESYTKQGREIIAMCFQGNVHA
ncbi:GNAT family N-acetyltransferase [Pseudoalteromonas luteoviolacea]|uniref:GNAT family N-acetyltransferase n=1 Tax=Pseudoalteromonas luteoviolacea TaxID=43657 RepID=UPI001F1D9B60|nr:GNAT family N-acetyltransferase [Pseudoalteromonas luteoviolacea]MCF6440289.1 GNAT family N-acetyltransferase [Pseudoalteromonas luteoviolacea]